MNPAELLDQINTRHQASFALVERYPDGEQGAFVVADTSGRRWVLKWQAGARNLHWYRGPQRVTDLLRAIGYPAPQYLLVEKLPEGIYSLQSALPGAPMRRLTPALLPRLLELNRLQVGRAVPDSVDFHQEVIKTVLHGGDGYCLHDSLRQHSRATADMLRALQAIVVEHQDQPHRTDDIVHVDFAHANILVHADQVSGVVDWQAAYAGDCSFDIASLLFYAYDDVALRARLWEYALTRASLELLSIYLAHMILRQVDWSLRYHDRAIAERYIASGQLLLQGIAERATTGNRPR
jgi:hypothetical protein